MNQRVAVRAIVAEDDKILLLKRANGRQTILGKYELPGGKVGYGEQPEDTLRRYLHDDAGLHIETARLRDVVTYVDHDDRDVQYIVVVYDVSLAQPRHAIELSGSYNKYRWTAMQKTSQDELTDLTQLLIGIIHQTEVTLDVQSSPQGEKTTDKEKVVLFSDGGSRGNPGPSAAGYVIVKDKEVIDQGGEYLGITTNNQAEYHAVRLGLERALELGYRRVDAKIDSMLVVNQMKGVYTIKNRELWPINERIRELVGRFDRVTFSHVRREFNQLADGMVNKTLDAHEASHKSTV